MCGSSIAAAAHGHVYKDERKVLMMVRDTVPYAPVYADRRNNEKVGSILKLFSLACAKRSSSLTRPEYGTLGTPFVTVYVGQIRGKLVNTLVGAAGTYIVC